MDGETDDSRKGLFLGGRGRECGSWKPENKLQNVRPERGLREVMLQGARETQVKNLGRHENDFRWPDCVCWTETYSESEQRGSQVRKRFVSMK